MSRVNTVGRALSQAHAAYLAGMFDSDGAIMAIIEPTRSLSLGCRVRIVLKSTQKSPTHLRMLIRHVGVGGLVKNRTTWDWLIRERGATRWLLSQIVGQTLVKRAQCRIALRILSMEVKDRHDLARVCRWADAFSQLNPRSKLRRRNTWSKVSEGVPRND